MDDVRTTSFVKKGIETITENEIITKNKLCVKDFA
jgi:hypothetical protein